MRIGGIERFSLTDFPGTPAAVVFTKGCNFRCPYCHNGRILSVGPASDNDLSAERVLTFLESRRGKLAGVVVSGGEPTIQPDLPQFLASIRKMGYAVKLDTNGSRPEMVERVIVGGLVDFIAMDVKAPRELYPILAGAPVDTIAVMESISLIASSGVPHLFRTTVPPGLLTNCDVAAIQALIPEGSPHLTQPCRTENALEPEVCVSGTYQAPSVSHTPAVMVP
ncbi:MAG: anaerobic ribonucleoside-triphosphate reductase activating protein [Deltaproteobacteria bacterium]|nr:anaerobic ribonucleoside-triphosphate reductase activating protein [Candidatus Zymogenaceae bacterium]